MAQYDRGHGTFIALIVKPCGLILIIVVVVIEVVVVIIIIIIIIVFIKLIHNVKRWVLRLDLKQVKLSSNLRSTGRSFQKLGPTTK